MAYIGDSVRAVSFKRQDLINLPIKWVVDYLFKKEDEQKDWIISIFNK